MTSHGNAPLDLHQAFADTIRGCQAVVESCLRDCRLHQVHVQVRLIDDWTLNAFAARENGLHVIGLHAGIIPGLLRPITAALAIGCISEVQDRDRLANWLLNATIDFLVFHELGHVALRHLEYREQALRLEFGVEDVQTADADDQLALELMADEFAVAAMRNRRFSGRYVDDGGVPEFSDIATYEHALLFAMGLLFLLMTPRDAFADFAVTSHPHPEFRVMVAWALLFTDRHAAHPELSKRVVTDLARMPQVLGIPDDAFIGTLWSVDSNKRIPGAASEKMRDMFERHTRAVQRLRPILHGYLNAPESGSGAP